MRSEKSWLVWSFRNLVKFLLIGDRIFWCQDGQFTILWASAGCTVEAGHWHDSFPYTTFPKDHKHPGTPWTLFPPYIPYLYRGLSCLNSSTSSSPSHMVHLACAIHHNTDPHDNRLKPIVHASLLILQLYNFFIALLYHNITNRENYNANFSHLFFKVVHRKLIGKKVWMLLELISRGWPRKAEHVCRYYGHEAVVMRVIIVMVDCRSKMQSVAVWRSG